MSKKKTKRRDTSRIANSGPYYTKQPLLPFPSDLPSLEDRRSYHPEGVARPARSFRSSRHRLTVSEPSQRAVRTSNPRVIRVGFENPREVLVCVRRKRRREVMFAFNKAGKVGQKKPRRSFYSSVKC